MLNVVRDVGTSIATSSVFVRSSGEDSVMRAICIRGSEARSTGKRARKVPKMVMSPKISALMSSSLRVDSNIANSRYWKR